MSGWRAEDGAVRIIGRRHGDVIPRNEKLKRTINWLECGSMIGTQDVMSDRDCENGTKFVFMVVYSVLLFGSFGPEGSVIMIIATVAQIVANLSVLAYWTGSQDCLVIGTENVRRQKTLFTVALSLTGLDVFLMTISFGGKCADGNCFHNLTGMYFMGLLLSGLFALGVGVGIIYTLGTVIRSGYSRCVDPHHGPDVEIPPQIPAPLPEQVVPVLVPVLEQMVPVPVPEDMLLIPIFGNDGGVREWGPVMVPVEGQVPAHIPAQVPAHIPAQVPAHIPAQVPVPGPIPKLGPFMDTTYDTILRINRYEQTTCAVCLTEFRSVDNITILPCGHIFHRRCQGRWREQKRECPICKTPTR